MPAAAMSGNQKALANATLLWQRERVEGKREAVKQEREGEHVICK